MNQILTGRNGNNNDNNNNKIDKDVTKNFYSNNRANTKQDMRSVYDNYYGPQNANKMNSYAGQNAYNTSVPDSIKSVIRFFAIFIIIFGLALSGSGAYSYVEYKNKKASSGTPVVSTERYGNSISIKITNEVGISSVIYNWNDSNKISSQGKGQTSMTITDIIIPSGKNKLLLTVVDVNGNSFNYVKNFEQQAQDVIKPEIILSTSGSSINILVTDDTELDYVEYKLGNESAEKVNADPSNPAKISIDVPMTQGQKTLKVTAVDKAKNVATKTQEVKGATKSTISVEPVIEPTPHLKVTVKDEEEIKMIVIVFNGQELKSNPNGTMGQEFIYEDLQLVPGDNTIKITVYNVSEQVSQFEESYFLQ